jgi:hypothetical protein
MFGGRPLHVRRGRPDILADRQGSRESAGQYAVSNEMPCFVVMSQFKSSMVNHSQSTNAANEQPQGSKTSL